MSELKGACLCGAISLSGGGSTFDDSHMPL